MKPAYLKRKADRKLDFLPMIPEKCLHFETPSNEKAKILPWLRRRCDMLKITPAHWATRFLAPDLAFSIKIPTRRESQRQTSIWPIRLRNPLSWLMSGERHRIVLHNVWLARVILCPPVLYHHFCLKFAEMSESIQPRLVRLPGMILRSSRWLVCLEACGFRI